MSLKSRRNLPYILLLVSLLSLLVLAAGSYPITAYTI
jgi:hypothetical protein